jgi:hypothetical protein
MSQITDQNLFGKSLLSRCNTINYKRPPRNFHLKFKKLSWAKNVFFNFLVQPLMSNNVNLIVKKTSQHPLKHG